VALKLGGHAGVAILASACRIKSHKRTVLPTITTTHQPATDVGHLLRKHPAHVHTAHLSFGQAYVLYLQSF
jgi:RNA repair, ligase-Pnkp-associating, region of Hen1